MEFILINEWIRTRLAYTHKYVFTFSVILYRIFMKNAFIIGIIDTYLSNKAKKNYIFNRSFFGI